MSVNVHFYKSKENCNNDWFDLNETDFWGIGFWNKMGEAWMETYQGGLYAYNGKRMLQHNIQLITVGEILERWSVFEENISLLYPIHDRKPFFKYWFDRIFCGDPGWVKVWRCVRHTKRVLCRMPKDLILYVKAG